MPSAGDCTVSKCARTNGKKTLVDRVIILIQDKSRNRIFRSIRIVVLIIEIVANYIGIIVKIDFILLI